MPRLSNKVKIILTAATVAGIALVVVVNYTDACRLEEITIDATPVENWPSRFAMLDADRGPIQPLDRLAEQLLGKDDVYRVDISWSPPHRIEVETNRFRPGCFLVDKKSGEMFGVDNIGRVVPLSMPVENWELPVLVGVTVGRVFKRCPDSRVEIVVRQLLKLRRELPDLFRLIEEIDFSDKYGLKVSIAGLPYRLIISAGSMLDDMDRFARFITRFDVDLSEVRQVDLRYEDLIICERGKG